MKYVEKHLRQTRKILHSLGHHRTGLGSGGLFYPYFPRFFLLKAFDDATGTE